MTNTYFEARKWAFSYLTESDVNLILMTQKNWNYSQLILHLRDEIDDFDEFKTIVLDVAKGIPVQYALKQARFFGRDFFVDERVLIPRIETEELIELILNDHDNKNINVLDIGTGSGVLATTLKKQRPSWNITASDISNEALEVAKSNAKKLDAQIDFVLSDAFKNIDGKYDIIVSNPPYIADDEVNIMDKSVIDYEPHLALFANDHGLAVYKKIAENLANFLKPNGYAYFEIGLYQGQSVQNIMQNNLLNSKVQIIKDMSGYDRIIKVML